MNDRGATPGSCHPGGAGRVSVGSGGPGGGHSPTGEAVSAMAAGGTSSGWLEAVV